jgi:hypothetical protein
MCIGLAFAISAAVSISFGLRNLADQLIASHRLDS